MAQGPDQHSEDGFWSAPGICLRSFGTGKTVLRGGYGLFYYLDRGGVGNELSNNPDFNGTSTYYACPTATTCASGYRFAFTGQRRTEPPIQPPPRQLFRRKLALPRMR